MMPLMDQELIRLAAQAPTTTEHRRPAQRAGAPDDFGAQVAAFYPYAQQPAEPALRAGSTEQRQRTASVGASSGLGRRRQPRDE
jgi:hypothetical protein